ncbi:MAG: ATP-binding protein [Bacteroidales bacterium]|nr:ATP-binding protein [Bacteroidales bacterium]
MNNFHVLIGANASGKTTFLDIISFICENLIKEDFFSGTNRCVCLVKNIKEPLITIYF